MSNNEKGYSVPQTRKEKIEFLKAFTRGEKTIDDLKEAGISVTLHLDGDKTYEEILAEWEKDKEDRKAHGIAGECVYVTLLI